MCCLCGKSSLLTSGCSAVHCSGDRYISAPVVTTGWETKQETAQSSRPLCAAFARNGVSRDHLRRFPRQNVHFLKKKEKGSEPETGGTLICLGREYASLGRRQYESFSLFINNSFFFFFFLAPTSQNTFYSSLKQVSKRTLKLDCGPQLFQTNTVRSTHSLRGFLTVDCF